MVSLAAGLIALIVGIQLFWLNKIYSFEQKNFNVNVVKSIRGLYEDVALRFSPTLNLQNLISHPSPDYFIFLIDTLPPADTLSDYLKQELEDFDVLTDVYLAVYEPALHSYQQLHYISTVASRYQEGSPPTLPVFQKENRHAILYFPHRKKYMLSQMRFWFISSGGLILALIALAISICVLYRQKFLWETQKDFLNNFTHEFKTPLAVMKIAAGVLLEDDILKKPERLKNYAGILQQQTDHLQQQVERLLKTATSKKQRWPIEKQPVDAAYLIHQAIRKIQPLADERQARIEVILPATPILLSVDAALIEMALINLLENALKYSREPRIQVEAGRQQQECFLSVKDNGIGIEKKYLSNIFTRFYRVPTGDVHDVKGFGLGLNYVKMAVTAHGGRINVQSLPGIGSAFKIILPAE